MKRNCCNCSYLEWAFGDIGDPEGFICNKKDLYGKSEREMIIKMDDDKYRDRSKVCHSPKEQD